MPLAPRARRPLAAAALALLLACDTQEPTCSEDTLAEMQEACLASGGDFTGSTYGSAEGACEASTSSARCEGVQKEGCAIACVHPGEDEGEAEQTALDSGGDAGHTGDPDGDTAAEEAPAEGGAVPPPTEMAGFPMQAGCSAAPAAGGFGALGALLGLGAAARRRGARSRHP